MADLLKIKKNVAKMASMGAPEEDIDGYITSEGVSLDDVRNFKMGQTNKLQDAIKGFYTEQSAPYMHGLSTLGFGIPKMLAGKVGLQETIFPEQKTVVGKMRRGVAETGGALLGGGKFLKGAEAVGKATIPWLAGKGLASKLALGTTTGALTGGAYSMAGDKENVLPKVALGGTLGLAGTALGEGIGKAVETFKTLKQAKKAVESMEGAKRQAKTIKENIGWKKQDIRKTTKQTVKDIKTEGVAARKLMEENLRILSNDLDEAVNTGSIDIQTRLPDFFRKNGEAYGKHLDDIADRLYKSNKPFTVEEARTILGNTLNELDEIGIVEGAPRQMIESLYQKYPQGTNLKLDFKEFNEGIKGIRKALSPQLKSGQRFAREDIASAILSKNFGEYVGTNVPEFVELQTAYRPVVQAMKEAGKWFKPYAGEYTNIGGRNLLRRAALSKGTPQESNLLGMLEEGSQFGEGIGRVSTKAKEVGQALKKGKETINLQREMEQQSLAKLQSRQEAQLGRLTQRSRKVDLYMRGREEEMLPILANQEKAKIIKNVLLGTAATMGAIGTGIYGMGSLIRGASRLNE